MLLRFIFHLLIITILTVVTQVGGLIYLLTLALVRGNTRRKQLIRLGVFIGLYLVVTFWVVPVVAPFFGREKIKETDNLKAQAYIYKLANRNYVRPALHKSLSDIAGKLKQVYPGIQLRYLDANFPFFDGFPLLPHLSHDDGKKVDVAFLYENSGGSLTNDKISVLGYGAFEAPKTTESNQPAACMRRGYWQYGLTKYLSPLPHSRDINFSEKGTANLLGIIARQPQVGKIFIEPHLQNRLGVSSSKIRFHGCHAVRHDDHIHFQLR